MKALRTYVITSLLLIAIVTGCEKERKDRVCEPGNVPCVTDSSKVNIRIRNATALPMCDFVFQYGDSAYLNLGFLAEGDSTCFIAVDSTFNNPALDYMVGNEPVIKDYNKIKGEFISTPKTFVTFDVYADQIIDTLPDFTFVYRFEARTIRDVITYP